MTTGNQELEGSRCAFRTSRRGQNSLPYASPTPGTNMFPISVLGTQADDQYEDARQLVVVLLLVLRQYRDRHSLSGIGMKLRVGA